LQDIFDLVPSFEYSGSITVSSTGSVVQLPEWCINQPASGSGNGGGGGGNDDTELLYPWVSNNASQFESILIANNFSNSSATVSLQARRANGDTQTETRIIPPGGFLKERASSLFDELGDGPGYSVMLSSSNDGLTGRWVTNNLTSASGQSPSQGVAVNLNQSGPRMGSELVFGYLPITNNFISAPVINNVGDGPTTVTLNFYSSDGTNVGTETLTDLDPYLPFATAVNNLVSSNSDIYMTATSDRQPITGVAFVFNNVGETAIGNASAIDIAAADTGSKTLIYPWVSNNEGAFESIFVVNNYGSSTATVQMTARRENGDTDTNNAQIPPNGFLQMSASALFPALGSGPGYTVELTADSSKVEGQWVTNLLQAASGASPSQGVAVNAALAGPGQRAGDAVMFGFLPLTETFVSAPVVVNLGADPTDITLYFYDENGTEVHRDTTLLVGVTPKRPFARVANTLVPENTGDVYMIARSNDGSPLTGVVFVFNGESEPAIGNVTGIDFNP
jgi:hypothetical protein